MTERHFEDRRQWHIDKTLNAGHLLTTLAIAGSLFAYAAHMDRRVTMLEERLAATITAQTDSRKDVRELATEIKMELRALRTDITQLMRSHPGVPAP